MTSFARNFDATTSPCQVGVGSYDNAMRKVSIKEAEARLAALARRVERGEAFVVTRNGKPIFDLVPHRRKGGINLKAIAAFRRRQGIRAIVVRVADDFDAPLHEEISLPPFV
jgi:prevent-host-death family protein